MKLSTAQQLAYDEISTAIGRLETATQDLAAVVRRHDTLVEPEAIIDGVEGLLASLSDRDALIRQAILGSDRGYD